MKLKIIYAAIATVPLFVAAPFPAAADGAVPALWVAQFGKDQGWDSSTHRVLADVNGDKRADVVGFFKDGVYVSVSTGTGFGPATRWVANFSPQKGQWQEDNPRFLADVNGDGKDDVVGFGDVAVWVSLSNGTGFDAPQNWVNEFGSDKGWQMKDSWRSVGDFNGDGMVDVVGWTYDDLTIGMSDGSKFSTANSNKWPIQLLSKDLTDPNSQGQHPLEATDVNGDGKAEILSLSVLFTGPPFLPTIHFPERGTDKRVVLSNLNGISAKDMWIAAHFSRAATKDVLHLGLPVDLACNMAPASSGLKTCAPTFPAFTDNGAGLSVDTSYPTLIGDVNGDGHADIVNRLGPAAEALLFDPNVVSASGDPYFFTWHAGWVQNGFSDSQSCNYAECPTLLGDVNADGKDDVLFFGTKGVWVSISN